MFLKVGFVPVAKRSCSCLRSLPCCLRFRRRLWRYYLESDECDVDVSDELSNGSGSGGFVPVRGWCVVDCASFRCRLLLGVVLFEAFRFVSCVACASPGAMLTGVDWVCCGLKTWASAWVDARDRTMSSMRLAIAVVR